MTSWRLIETKQQQSEQDEFKKIDHVPLDLED